MQTSFRDLPISEKQLQQILEALPIGVSVHQPDGSILYLNPMGETISGRQIVPGATAQFLSTAYGLYRGDHLYPIAALPALRALKGEFVVIDDLELHRPDGQIIPLEVRSIPIFDDQGRVICSVNTFQDIAQRKAAEKVLADYNRVLEAQVKDRTIELARLNDQLSQAILDHTQTEQILRQERDFSNTLIQASPAFYVAIDAAGKTLMMNDEMLKALGYRAEEVIGADYITTFVPAGDRAMLSQIFAQQVNLKQSVVSENYVQTKAGNLLLIEWRGTPVLNADGSFNFFFGIGIDITERKRAEEVLRESEERFRSAFDDAGIGMSLTSLNGQFLKVNRSLCDLLGYSEVELLGLRFQDITHADDLVADMALLDRLLAGNGHNFAIEKRYLNKQGEVIWVLVTVSAIRDPQDQPLYCICQVQDIRERREVDRLKNEFISIVSHELRTPLTAIRGSLGLIATGIYDHKPQKAKRMIDIAIAESDRLARLVNDILDVERLDSGKVKLAMEVCEVSDLMQRAVEGMQAISSSYPQGVVQATSITLCFTPLSAQVWAAPDAILQTLINLLSNAIKFSPPDSTVWLSAEMVESKLNAQCSKIRFAVKDQGWGIPADKLEMIFDRFQQIDVSNSRQKGGTGLGLSICRSIVQQHGGEIWAESSLKVPTGSTFYFTLPTPNR
ncbi:PAS domain-containing sensor histidine kinase [Phormidesmis priestleyi]